MWTVEVVEKEEKVRKQEKQKEKPKNPEKLAENPPVAVNFD